MSQDNETCAKCGKLCGYDDRKCFWWGERETFHDTALCGDCKDVLIRKCYEFLGINCSNSDSGVEIEWHDLDKLLSDFVHDFVSYYSIYKVSDKQRYERVKHGQISGNSRPS